MEKKNKIAIFLLLLMVLVLIAYLLIDYIFIEEEKSIDSKVGDGVCNIETERGTPDCYLFPYGEFETWRSKCEDVNNGTYQKDVCVSRELIESFDSGDKGIFYCCA